jgi:hypothetical protein
VLEQVKENVTREFESQGVALAPDGGTVPLSQLNREEINEKVEFMVKRILGTIDIDEIIKRS